MAEIKLFQICHEGDLTIDLSRAMRRLGAEPSFDQSWFVWLTEERHSAALVRWLRRCVSADARILVACTQFTTSRDFLMIRHSMTPGADYRELHNAIARLGVIVDLPFESTFIVQSDDHTDLATLGAALGELCPDESLMVVGINHDWAFCDSGVSRMNLAVPSARETRFRSF
ncbi:MAG: hypothetical protein M3041_20215 [Acidobacteriota bacterium]|nr:hypothetical protein [Acidobacteriota bacterium]